MYTLVVAGVGFRTLTHHVSLWSWSLVHVLVVRTTLLLNKCTVASVVHVRFVHDMACATLRLLKSVVSVHVKMQSFGTYNVQDVSRHLIRQENTFYPTQWR